MGEEARRSVPDDRGGGADVLSLVERVRWLEGRRGAWAEGTEAGERPALLMRCLT